MLEDLRISGLGVIDDAVLELDRGLTVLTGETGAGKTMVVNGLALLLGARADASRVAAGRETALVEGRLQIDDGSEVARLVDGAGGIVEDAVVLLSRSVSSAGRSRAFLGGRAVPVVLLAEVAATTVAIHGQSDQHRLLLPAQQRAALDRFAGAAVSEPLAEYGDLLGRLRAVDAELVEITDHAAERAREADLLRFGLAEIDAVGPEAGEDAGLGAEAERLAHADALRSAAQIAHAVLAGDPESPETTDVLSALAAARRSLEQVASHDPQLAAVADQLAEAGYGLADAAAALASYADAVEADPVRLAAVLERRAALAALGRKYGPAVDDVLAWAAAAAPRLAELADDDDRVAALRGRRDDLRGRLAVAAAALSQARAAAATALGRAVTAELRELALPHARVEIVVEQRDDARGLPVAGRTVAFGPCGVDDVTFQLAAAAAAPALPIARGASGGELSRVMLALEVVLAGSDPAGTLVFDEVDAGVGGRAAVEVGRRLARLARDAQVLVVTHLPQVAAFADRHLVVRKESDGSVVRSGVQVLDEPGRIRELSRMLAGREESATGHAHAEELLAAARAAKGGPLADVPMTARVTSRERRVTSGTMTA